MPPVMRGESRTGGPIFLITLEEGHGGARRKGQEGRESGRMSACPACHLCATEEVTILGDSRSLGQMGAL